MKNKEIKIALSLNENEIIGLRDFVNMAVKAYGMECNLAFADLLLRKLQVSLNESKREEPESAPKPAEDLKDVNPEKPAEEKQDAA